MEKGYYHPSRGYWQTLSGPNAEVLATFPEGTLEVPLKPGADYEWDEEDGEWVYVEPAPTLFQAYLNNGGLARFTGSPAALLENIRMAAVTRISKGRHRVFHQDPYPTDQYSAVASVFDPLPRTIRVTARTNSYVEVRVTDLAGAAQDATEITVKTERVVTS
jgi:hypothetical protein